MIDPVYLAELRRRELGLALAASGVDVSGLSVLEIGSGNGAQLVALRARGASATGVDLASSVYSGQRLADIIDYDGETLPFADRSFDVVFSSHVLEHVGDLPRLSGEMRRVLRPGGRALHVMPSAAWKAYTQATWPLALARAAFQLALRRPGGAAVAASVRRRSPAELASLLLMPPRHGEHGTALGEFWTYRRAWWRARLASLGWTVLKDRGLPIAYSGSVIFGDRISFAAREGLGSLAGGSANLFLLCDRLGGG